MRRRRGRRRWTARSATSSARAKEDRPALLIVGAVVGLRGHLRWFDARPLFGRRIVVTRAREQAGALAEALEQQGAQVIALPAIRILPPSDPAALDAACDGAETFDWLVFTSVNAVRHFMSRFLARRDIRDLKGPNICTVGPSTAAAVARVRRARGRSPPPTIVRKASFRRSPEIGASRQRAVPAAAVGDRPRAAGRRNCEPPAATSRRWRPTRRSAAGKGSAQDIYRMLLDREIDAVTFTSASTVRHFVELLGAEVAADLLRATTVAAIGPVTAEAAAQLGIDATVVPAEFTIPALVDALVDFFTAPSAPATVR